jgi:glycosyltransferase involved in cell wall biosynthesis
MNRPKPRLALVHPWLRPLGGSEPVALWTARELRDDYEIEILTMGESGLDELNAAYGTDLAEPGVRLRRFRVPRLLRSRGDAWRAARLVRRVRARIARFDILLSAYNPLDFGRPGIQYVSDFSFSDPLRRALLADARDWRPGFLPARGARRFYLEAARRFSGQTAEGWKANLTIANSGWTRRLLADAFGVASEVVYPPVPDAAPPPPWEGRAESFVSLGRIVPEKRVDGMIGILDRVRAVRPGLSYHVLGQVPDSDHGRAVAAKAAAAGSWVDLAGPVFGPAKSRLLSACRFGLAGCAHESFGIAAAEMVRAGMIVWVPASGGQTEIVDHPDLVYADDAEAAVKIAAVLADPGRQAVLRDHLSRQAGKFSTDRFRSGMRAAVDRFRDTHVQTPS